MIASSAGSQAKKTPIGGQGQGRADDPENEASYRERIIRRPRTELKVEVVRLGLLLLMGLFIVICHGAIVADGCWGGGCWGCRRVRGLLALPGGRRARGRRARGAACWRP